MWMSISFSSPALSSVGGCSFVSSLGFDSSLGLGSSFSSSSTMTLGSGAFRSSASAAMSAAPVASRAPDSLASPRRASRAAWQRQSTMRWRPSVTFSAVASVCSDLSSTKVAMREVMRSFWLAMIHAFDSD